MDKDRPDALDAVLPAIARFRRIFGQEITPAFVAELIAARELDLSLPDRLNEPGADAVDPAGQRYQIKYRSASTLNVDLNTFDFGHLVLVNMDDHYTVTGMWLLPVDRAKEIFSFRPKFRKYQTTQQKLKREATRIR